MSKKGAVMNRRCAMLTSVITVTMAAGLLATETMAQDKKTISEKQLHNRISNMVSGVYKDALTYKVKLPENYMETVPSEIWPDVMTIVGRRFTITND